VLDDSEEELSELVVNRFYVFDFETHMNHYALHLNPLLLLLRKTMRTFSLSDFFVKFVDNDRDEKIHNEESGDENIGNKE
jgi:hypothetical protein